MLISAVQQSNSIMYVCVCMCVCMSVCTEVGNGNSFQYSCLENYRTEEPGRLQILDLQRVRCN